MKASRIPPHCDHPSHKHCNTSHLPTYAQFAFSVLAPLSDGGLFRSLNGLQTVENLSLDGLRISQYYTTHTCTTDPDHVVAGAQDQGYQRADVPGPCPLDFEQIISGDYAHAVSGDGSHDYVYSVYPGFALVQIGEDSPTVTTQPQCNRRVKPTSPDR